MRVEAGLPRRGTAVVPNKSLSLSLASLATGTVTVTIRARTLTGRQNVGREKNLFPNIYYLYSTVDF